VEIVKRDPFDGQTVGVHDPYVERGGAFIFVNLNQP
jgi:hypothetical protein